MDSPNICRVYSVVKSQHRCHITIRRFVLPSTSTIFSRASFISSQGSKHLFNSSMEVRNRLVHADVLTDFSDVVHDNYKASVWTLSAFHACAL